MSTNYKLKNFSSHLQSKGLTKEAEYLKNMIEEMEEEMEDMELEEKEELVEFDEGAFDKEDSEGMMEEMEDMPMEEMEGDEFSFEGQSTSNFHCCPEAKEAMASVCDMAGSEEETDLCMELMEELDAFLGDKLSLMEDGGSKEELCEFVNKGLSAMYVVGQASGVMDEDIAESFQFVADAIEEVCSELLEE